jgi:SAM-dependent methyltransferase
MKLNDLQRHWTALGDQDPLWAILSDPAKRGGAWQLDEFFATGKAGVARVLDALSERGVAVERRRALDFGCGVGRLTQALADHFESCDGVDLAASMIGRAQSLNRQPEHVRFHHNQAPNLRLFDAESFDFVLSLLVLQHMEPGLMRGYVGEFLRVLRPGGVAYFNIPERGVFGDPLPPEAWRAEVCLSNELPAFVAGRVVPVGLNVRNDSPVRWPASAELCVGDRWRTSGGAAIVSDGARALLGADLSPRQELLMRLEAVAPDEPGDYVLEIDLIHERVGWFGDRGSTPLRLPVTVADSSASPECPYPEATSARGADQSPVEPVIEMYAMSHAEVTVAVNDAGGAVLATIPIDRCGPAHPSLDYVVARSHD